MNWDLSYMDIKPGAVVPPIHIKLDTLMLWLRHMKHINRVQELHELVQRRIRWMRSRRDCVCFVNIN